MNPTERRWWRGGAGLSIIKNSLFRVFLSHTSPKVAGFQHRTEPAFFQGDGETAFLSDEDGAVHAKADAWICDAANVRKLPSVNAEGKTTVPTCTVQLNVPQSLSIHTLPHREVDIIMLLEKGVHISALSDDSCSGGHCILVMDSVTIVWLK